jgi:tRNA (Thr-GGU) A37 N-methylase
MGTSSGFCSSRNGTRDTSLFLEEIETTSIASTGVFATRSPDRPNPLGLHRVTVLEIAGKRVKVGLIEAIDGTPVVDIKPVLYQSTDS